MRDKGPVTIVVDVIVAPKGVIMAMMEDVITPVKLT